MSEVLVTMESSEAAAEGGVDDFDVFSQAGQSEIDTAVIEKTETVDFDLVDVANGEAKLPLAEELAAPMGQVACITCVGCPFFNQCVKPQAMAIKREPEAQEPSTDLEVGDEGADVNPVELIPQQSYLEELLKPDEPLDSSGRGQVVRAVYQQPEIDSRQENIVAQLPEPTAEAVAARPSEMTADNVAARPPESTEENVIDKTVGEVIGANELPQNEPPRNEPLAEIALKAENVEVIRVEEAAEPRPINDEVRAERVAPQRDVVKKATIDNQEKASGEVPRIVSINEPTAVAALETPPPSLVEDCQQAPKILDFMKPAEPVLDEIIEPETEAAIFDEPVKITDEAVKPTEAKTEIVIDAAADEIAADETPPLINETAEIENTETKVGRIEEGPQLDEIPEAPLAANEMVNWATEIEKTEKKLDVAEFEMPENFTFVAERIGEGREIAEKKRTAVNPEAADEMPAEQDEALIDNQPESEAANRGYGATLLAQLIGAAVVFLAIRPKLDTINA